MGPVNNSNALSRYTAPDMQRSQLAEMQAEGQTSSTRPSSAWRQLRGSGALLRTRMTIDTYGIHLHKPAPILRGHRRIMTGKWNEKFTTVRSSQDCRRSIRHRHGPRKQLKHINKLCILQFPLPTLISQRKASNTDTEGLNQRSTRTVALHGPSNYFTIETC